MTTQNGRAIKTVPWVLILLGVLSIVGVMALVIVLTQGGPDAMQKAQLVGTFVTPTIAGLLIAYQGQKTHNLVNSMASAERFKGEQLKFAQGVTAGIKQEAAMPAREKEGGP